jgi:hypothetical protein
LEPKQWWGIHDQHTPELKSITLKVLGQPLSFSACEMNLSTYGFVYSLRRNKLTPTHAYDLVFVHSNMCLLSRRIKDSLKGLSQMWDVGKDNHEIFDGAGILQFAYLSLDKLTRTRA